jgi:hypothetical protein
MPSHDNATAGTSADILSFPHVRWRWQAQRPQQLLLRAAQDRRVIVVEEPAFEPADARLDVHYPHANVILLRPCLPYSMAVADTSRIQRTLLDTALRDLDARVGMLWYFTPMALLFSRHLRAPLVVYSCMEEPADGERAPDGVRLLERQLLRRADLVFTDGEHHLGAASDPTLTSSDAERATERHQDGLELGVAGVDRTWAYMRELMVRAAERIGRVADPRSRSADPFSVGVGAVPARRATIDSGR